MPIKRTYTYTAGGKTYEIPEKERNAFEKDFPDASIRMYGGGKTYDIPLGDVDEFIGDFPDGSFDVKEEVDEGVIGKMRDKVSNTLASARATGEEAKKNVAEGQNTSPSPSAPQAKPAKRINVPNSPMMPEQPSVNRNDWMIGGEQPAMPETQKEATQLSKQARSRNEAAQSYANRDWDERMNASNEAAYAEAVRKESRKKYDDEHFEDFYQTSVAPQFEASKAEAEKSAESKIVVPNPYSTGDFESFMNQVAIERETDPAKVTANVISNMDQGALGNYVFGRMGIKTDEDTPEGYVSVPMTEGEKAVMERLISDETNEVVTELQNRMYEEYKKASAPQSVLDYILGSAFHNNIAARLNKAMVQNAAESSGIREQLRQMAEDEYGKGQSWGARAVANTAPFAVDVATGGFTLPSMAGQAVKTGLLSAAARRGLSAAAAEATERYLIQRAPALMAGINAISGMANFGTLGVQSEAIRQLGEGNFDGQRLINAFIEEAPLGGALAIGGALGYITRNSGNVVKAVSDIGGLAAETSAFAAASGIREAINEGIDVYDVDWGRTFGDAAGMVIGMKSTGALMNPVSTARNLRNRYYSSKKYNVDLNQYDVDNLKENGYDLSDIFKGMRAVADIATSEPKTIRRKTEVESVDGTPVEGLENVEVDPSMLEEILNNPNITSDAKRKIVYLANGRILMPEKVYNADAEVNGDVMTITRYNAAGDVIGREDVSVGDGERILKGYKDEGRSNTVEAIEKIVSSTRLYQRQAEEEWYRQNGFDTEASKGWVEARASQIAQERSGRLKASAAYDVSEKTGIDIDEVLAKNPSERTPSEDAAVDLYIKNLQDLFSQDMSRAEIETADYAGAAISEGVQEGRASMGEGGDPHSLKMAYLNASANVDEGVRAELDTMLGNEEDSRKITAYIKTLPEGQQEAAIAYVRAESSMRGIENAIDGEVETAVHDEKNRVSPAVYVPSGTDAPVLTTAIVDGKEVYIKNYDPSSPNVQIADLEEGKITQEQKEHIGFDESTVRTVGYAEYIQGFEDDTRTSVSQRAMMAANHNRKTNLQMEQGSLINSENGQMYVFANDGETVQLLPTQANAETNQIEPVSGQPITMKVDDAVAMQDAYNDGVDYGVPQAEAEEAPVEEAQQEELEEAPVEEAAPVPANAETAVADIRTQMDNAGLSEAADAIDQGNIPSMAGMTEEQQGLALRYMDAVNALAEENARRTETQTAAAEPAKPTIPVDKKTGVKLYEQGVELDDAIEDIKKDGFTVSEVADISIAEAQKELEKVQKKVAKGAQTREELYDSRSDNPKTEYGKSLKRAKELQGVIDYYTRLKAREEELGKPAQEELENVAKAAAEDTLPKAVEETHEEGASEQPAAETEAATPVEETQEETKDPLIEAYEREQDTVDTEGGLVKNEVAENNLSPVWRKALHGLGRHLGRRVVVVSEEDAGRVLGDKASQGMYDSNTNTVYLNEAYIRNGEDMLAFVAGHEITHALKDDNPEVWKYFVDAVKDAMGEEAFNERVQKILDRYNSTIDRINEGGGLNGRKLKHLSRAGAEEEVCADWAGRNVMTDAEAAQRILDAAANAGADPKSLIKKVLDWINGMLESLKAALKRGENVSDSIDAFNTAKKIWQDMYNIATAKNNARKEETERLAENGMQVDEEKGDVRHALADILDKDEFEQSVKDLMKVTGRSEKTVRKWLKTEQSLANVILDNDNAKFLDMQVDESVPSIWNNSDYPQGTVEFSNICRKRLPLTMIYQRLQEEFPNTVFDASTLETIRQVLKENGVDVACGLCFVEDRRQLLGEIGQGFIDLISGKSTTDNEKQQKAYDKLRESGDSYVPNLYELLTLDGMKKLRKGHPAVAQAFVEYNNARGMQAGRLFQAYSAYHREILKYSPSKVKSINNNGGLRIFSFSDFEAHHLIDLVQVLADCATKGIKVQGYTKVPEFAKAVKDTGMKLNRSLIPKGVGYVDADYVPKEGEAVSPNVIDGKRLLFDCVEGIDVNHPDFFDSTDSKSVGNIVVGINDEHIRLAMLDPFVDYIIPLHTGLSEEIRKKKGIDEWTNYKLSQLEKKRNDKGKLVNADKHGINIYTDVLPRGEELIGKPIANVKDFQKAFFKACEEKDWIPRFEQFIDKNKNGKYVYTKGYDKLLPDFKLFDKNGKLIPQEVVVPVFDNDLNKRILEEYVKGEKEKAPNEEVYGKVKDALGLDNPRFSLSTEIEAQYPNWMDNQTPEVEGKRGQNTQVAGTVGTYKKVGKWIEDNLGKDAKILDASSGLGLGTLELRKQGFDVEDIEPYPGKGRDEQPTYGGLGAYQRAMDDGKQYDYIISNAVLNVIPDDWRNGVLHDMATLLKEGGKMFINTRKAGEEKTIKNKIELESPQEVLVGTPDKITSYQRFFTPQELKKYVQDELGEGYTVTIANEKNSGTKGLAAVVVTKESPDGGKTTIQDILGTNKEEPRFSLRGEVGAANDPDAMANLSVAKDMDKAKRSAKSIWLATGWEKGADGKWRNEIPDVKAKPLDFDNVETIEDIVDAPELFAAYPQLKDYKVQFTKMKNAGSINHDDKLIKLDKDYNTDYSLSDEDQKELNERTMDYIRNGNWRGEGDIVRFKKNWIKKHGVPHIDKEGIKTIAHELQHAVQGIEGFARGGSVSGMAYEYLKELAERDPELSTFAKEFADFMSVNDMMRSGKKAIANWLSRDDMDADDETKANLKKVADSMRDMSDAEFVDYIVKAKQLAKQARKVGEERYDRLAGEIEAKNVEDRLDMTDEERRSTPPSETEDLSRENQIVRFSLADDLKKAQMDIISKSNPADESLGEHTWIKSVDDIKTFDEAIAEYGENENLAPDYTADMAQKAKETGKITVYSSKPIDNGIFVTPSKMEAKSYAGEGEVYSKKVRTSDVAWIDGIQGQYAKVEGNQPRFSISDIPFYSNAEKAVDGIKQEKATPEQWLKMIEKAGGLKAGEDKWMGLSDWLKGQDKKSLTKQELMDYIRQNQIQIEETNYSEGREIFDEIERRYPGFEKAYYVEADDFDGTPSYSIRDLNAAVDLYNNHHPENYRIDVDDEGNITNDQYDDLINYAAEMFELGSKSAEVRGIDPTRLNYTTNGLDNKREIALVVPSIDPYRQDDTIHFGDAGEGRAVAWIRFGETTAHTDEYYAAKKAADDYLAEMREKYGVEEGEETDRMTDEEIKHLQELTGKEVAKYDDKNRVLVIDEIQSKRHQEGREKGYIDPETKAKIERFKILDNKMGTGFGLPNNEYEELQELRSQGIGRLSFDMRDAVPDAPFEKNWHELAMKRMLRYAAENGYDKVAWTKGEQQAERYDMKSAISNLYASKDGDKYEVEVYDADGKERTFNGLVGDSRASGTYTADELKKYFGAEAAKVIMSSVEKLPSKEEVARLKAIAEETEKKEDRDAWRNARRAKIDGSELFKGEGMKGFYDQMLPRFMDKYGKKWGVKTGEVELPNVEEAGRKMWAVDVTPEMKESVMQGQPMFSLADEDRTAVESYDAGEPTFVERLTNSLLELQNRNEENTVARMNAISSIGARLSDINKAMRAQKEYDKGTVDSLVRLAKMLLAQTKTMLKPDEQVKIWNALAKVVGKKNITQEANRVVDVLVDSELRTLKGLLDKIRKTKGVKLNSSGVETMGRLDIIGQRLVNAFNDGLKMKEEDLQNRIAETNMRLYEADSPTARESIDAELRGLELAQRYHEEIGGAESTIAGIRSDINTAREDPESVGISKGKERADYIRELQQRIRDEKISVIPALASIVAELSGEVKAGKTRAKMMRDEDLARKQEIWHDANSDLLGVPNDSGAHKKTVKEKWAENRFLRLALQPLATFNEMLRFFGESTVRGEGRLFNRFMPQFIWASDREWRRMKENRRVIDEKLSEIMGKKTEWSDLYRMESKMPTVPVTVKEGKEEKTYDLTQGNMLYIYMANKMTDGKVKLRKMGITEEDVEALKEKIDPRFIELADWIQSEFLPSKRKEFNEVHERMYGVPMADIEDYFPLKIDKNARASDFDVKVGNSNEHKPSTVTGSIIKRTFNTAALDITRADAFDALYNHLQDMEHWAAFAEFSRDLNTLIQFPNFRKKVQNMKSLRYGNGEQIFKTFEKVAQIASGSYTPTVDRGSLDSLAVNIGKGVTMSKISFRLFTAMKQLLSAPAYISEASPANLAKYGAPVMWASNFNWAIENVPGFSKRWESRQAGDYRLKRDDLDWTIWNTRLVDKLSKWGMTPNAFVDALTVAIGARAIYETNYKRMLKEGYDRDIAHQRALEKATSYNETQQSSENAYLAPIQVDRTAASVGFTAFRNASMGYERRLVRAVVDLRNSMKSGYKDRAVEQIMKQAMKDGLDEEQARKSAERIYDRGRWRDIADVAIFGYGLQFLWNLGPYIVDLLFGDDDDKEKALKDAAIHALFGPIEGLTGGNVVSDGINNIINGEWYKVLNSSAGQMPIVSDIKKVLQDLQKDEYAAIVDIVHLLMSSGLGVNPSNVSDWTAAIMDAGKGLAGEDGDNLEASEELTLLLLRLAEVPKSQTDKFFLDRVFGESPRDVDPERIDAMLKRYTDYKRNSTEFLLRPVRDLSDEGREKIEDKWVKRFETERKERMKALANEDDAVLIEKYEKEIRSDLIKKGKDDRTAEEDDLYDTYNEYKRYFKKGTDESERPQSSVDSISRVLAGLIEKYIADNGEEE